MRRWFGFTGPRLTALSVEGFMKRIFALVVLCQVGCGADVRPGLDFYGEAPSHVDEVVAAVQARLPCLMTLTADVYFVDAQWLDDTCCGSYGSCYGCTTFHEDQRPVVKVSTPVTLWPDTCATVTPLAHELTHLVWEACGLPNHRNHPPEFMAFVDEVNEAVRADHGMVIP
jgi:hypothetical protein